MNNIFRLLICAVFLFTGNGLHAQDSTAVKDSLQINVDHNKHKADSIHSTLDNEKFYLFSNLKKYVFDGFGSAIRFNPHQQLFDFMQMGRPQFAAPVNMFPHQGTYIYDGFSLNEHTNGMFNSRFISADQTDNIEYGLNAFARNSAVINGATISAEEAYTRLKYYEGDNSYGDLDLLFIRDLGKDVKLQLAGFNKGYNGYLYNSRHTGLGYNTKLSYRISEDLSSEFSWLRNHEIAGMGIPGQAENFTYRSDAQRFATRFFYRYDSTSSDQISLGLSYGYNFHRNKSRDNNYYSSQRSDNYRAYLAANRTDSLFSVQASLHLENYNNYGTVFEKNFDDYILSGNLSGKYQLLRQVYLEGSAGIKYLADFNPALDAAASYTMFHSRMMTRLKAGYSQRLPNPVERSITFMDYLGSKDLDSETLLSLSLLEKWSITKDLFLQTEAGYRKLQNEIIIDSTLTFKNDNERSWYFINGQGHYNLWLFTLSAGAQLLSADNYISPKQSIWSELTFHGNLFGGTIVLDLTGFTKWNAQHDLIRYDPIVNRFYQADGKNLSYMNVGFKAVATVSDAELFMEIDNLLNHEISYIDGYLRDINRIRFGVNWVMWD